MIQVNASPFWPGAFEYGDYSLVRAWALKQIALGLNTYSTAGSWNTVLREYADKADAIANCVYFANLLRMKRDPDVLDAYNARFGTSLDEIPITLHTSLGDYWPSGWDLTWNGVSGESSLFRTASIGGDDPPTSRDDSAELPYCDVYHTGVGEQMHQQGLGLRELIGKNGHAHNVRPARLWCPNYRGHYYRAAMQKFAQYIEWLRPVHVVMDEECFGNSATADNDLHTLIFPDGEWNKALASCSRCRDHAGYEAGKDSYANKIVELVHVFCPDATVTFYDIYSVKDVATTEKYGAVNYLNFGDWSDSGITVNSPCLYSLSFAGAPTAEYVIQRTMRVARWADVGYEDKPPTNESGNYGGWNLPGIVHKSWACKPGAIRGAYVWLTHCATETMDLHNNPGGYLSDETLRSLCDLLARDGAVGCYFYPGYSVNQPDCPNNQALDRLIPVAIRAFQEQQMSTISFKIELPTLLDADVVERELTVQVGSEPPNVQTLPADAAESAVYSGPQDAQVLVTLVDIDDAGNRSEPSKLDFLLVDTFPPAKPGPLSVVQVGESNPQENGVVAC